MPQRLGQHFLKNNEAIKKIIAALDLKEGEMVVEIGPGTGALTAELLKYPIKLIGVEKDSYLAEKLSNLANKKLIVINDDIITYLPKLITTNYKLVGNIPYYLTGFLFRTISELKNKPSLIIFTIQKEVAERITAQPPHMNLLAASIQIWAEPEILTILPPEDFDPPPKVDSAIIKFKVKSLKFKVNLENYYKLIKAMFKQPRKTILNNLSEGLNISKEETKKILQEVSLTGEERGQDLSIEKLVELSEVMHL